MNVELNHCYVFKREFCKMLKIPDNQVERRTEELLEWLTNFFDYEFYKGCPNRILIREIYGEYQPLPRKAPRQEEWSKYKKEKYEEYTKNQFNKQNYEPNSVMKVAREAKNEFGEEEFGHTSEKAIANRYIRESFYRYGENNNHFVWVNYLNYKPLSDDLLFAWSEIRREEKIGESEAANAFYAQENGEDITEQKSAYQKALKRFRNKYGITPVCVKEWRLKEEHQDE